MWFLVPIFRNANYMSVIIGTTNIHLVDFYPFESASIEERMTTLRGKFLFLYE